MRGSSSPATFGLASPVSLCCTLQLRLFYVHKGTRSASNSLPWRHGLFLAQSISGDTAVGHSLACAHAVERLADITVPARARALRVVLLELERLYNHGRHRCTRDRRGVYRAGESGTGTREGLVRLQDELFGTRLLRGTIALAA